MRRSSSQLDCPAPRCQPVTSAGRRIFRPPGRRFTACSGFPYDHATTVRATRATQRDADPQARADAAVLNGVTAAD